jgi:hypothetical protein
MNQLARTYSAQLDALKRYRTKAEPNIAVQNVSIAKAGGDAIGGASRPARPEADTGIVQSILGRPCPAI